MVKFDYSIIIIGASFEGTTTAIEAAKAGKRVLLIDHKIEYSLFHRLANSFLKSSAKIGQSLKEAHLSGFKFMEPCSLNVDNVLQRAKKMSFSLAYPEIPQNISNITKLEGLAAFESPNIIKVIQPSGSISKYSGEQIIIACGQVVYASLIPGYNEVAYLTADKIFELNQRPKSLFILDPGSEEYAISQSLRRLGTNVTIALSDKFLLKGEDEIVQRIIYNTLRKEGIEFYFNTQITKLSPINGTIEIHGKSKIDQKVQRWETTHLLLSGELRPNVNKLDLTRVHIESNHSRIMVDSYGKTSLKNVWAIGPISGCHNTKKSLEKEAHSIIKTILGQKTSLSRELSMIRLIEIEPEIVLIGLNEAQAIAKYGQNNIAVLETSLEKSERGLIDNFLDGSIKIIIKKKNSQILGALLFFPGAVEVANWLAKAIKHEMPLSCLANLTNVHPNYSEAIANLASKLAKKSRWNCFLEKFLKPKDNSACHS